MWPCVWNKIWTWDFGQNKGFIKALILPMFDMSYLLTHLSPQYLPHVTHIYTLSPSCLHRLEYVAMCVERDMDMGL